MCSARKGEKESPTTLHGAGHFSPYALTTPVGHCTRNPFNQSSGADRNRVTAWTPNEKKLVLPGRCSRKDRIDQFQTRDLSEKANTTGRIRLVVKVNLKSEIGRFGLSVRVGRQENAHTGKAMLVLALGGGSNYALKLKSRK